MTRAALLLAAALLASCGVQVPQGPREPERYFILAAPTGAKAATAVHLPPTSTASFYDTQEMAYSREPGTRAYYQFNHWTERPGRALHAQLASRFDEPSGGKGLVLRTRLDEIYHDAAQPPGTARIVLTAQLVDPERGVIARRTFTASAPAASYDAPGAVRGFNQALGTLLDEIVAWVDAQGGT
jgi:cholesterol transport system auxiliary component